MYSQQTTLNDEYLSYPRRFQPNHIFPGKIGMFPSTLLKRIVILEI